MNNWTIVSVSTEQVQTIAPVRTRTTKRLTRRGRIVVATLYAVGALLVGTFLANCLLDGLEAEGRMRDAQSAPYIEALQHKKLQSLDH